MTFRNALFVSSYPTVAEYLTTPSLNDF